MRNTKIVSLVTSLFENPVRSALLKLDSNQNLLKDSSLKLKIIIFWLVQVGPFTGEILFLEVNDSDVASKSLGVEYVQITQKFVIMSSRINKNFVCPSTQHIDVFDIHMSAYIVVTCYPCTQAYVRIVLLILVLFGSKLCRLFALSLFDN